jgi:hypothetical protein
MKAISLKNTIVIVLIIVIGTCFARADRQELLTMISRKQAEFEFKDITITEALDNISSELGAEILLSDEAQWKLPHGVATRLSASLKGSLAECLTEMLNAFFMRYAVSNNEITIYPRQELEHILGRPSTKQLELLKKIYSMRIDFTSGISKDIVLRLIKDAFGTSSFLPWDIPPKIPGILETMSTDKGITSVSFVVLLEQVGNKYDTPRWYLSGMDFPDQPPVIRMVGDEEYREAVLDQVIDISFQDEWADVIVQRLAGWTGMELFVDKADPSWLEEEMSVTMLNIKLGQALRNIVSSLDGETVINFGGNYIEIKGPMHPQKVAAPRETKSSGGSGEGYVGKISIPMGQGENKYYIEFMLRESDLTEGLKKLREDKIKEILKKFSKAGDTAAEIAARPQTYSILN